jgi:hypothetical protein
MGWHGSYLDGWWVDIMMIVIFMLIKGTFSKYGMEESKGYNIRQLLGNMA